MKVISGQQTDEAYIRAKTELGYSRSKGENVGYLEAKELIYIRGSRFVSG